MQMKRVPANVILLANHKKVRNAYYQKKKFIIIVHSWCGGHFTSINTCGVWKAMTGDQVSREEIRTHIHLD